MIRNRADSFFSITGLRATTPNGDRMEQPVIIQSEIGYLGIICKVFKETLYFLMQAKIEPGNLNKVQLSPTIQAIKSNFTQRHGGAKPAYLEYFTSAAPEELIVDQMQSEQSSRFYQKRNIVIRTEREVPPTENQRWMTLGQFKALMRHDNLVNMDTRTVLSYLLFGCLVRGENQYILLVGRI